MRRATDNKGREEEEYLRSLCSVERISFLNFAYLEMWVSPRATPSVLRDIARKRANKLLHRCVIDERCERNATITDETSFDYLYGLARAHQGERQAWVVLDRIASYRDSAGATSNEEREELERVDKAMKVLGLVDTNRLRVLLFAAHHFASVEKLANGVAYPTQQEIIEFIQGQGISRATAMRMAGFIRPGFVPKKQRSNS